MEYIILLYNEHGGLCSIAELSRQHAVLKYFLIKRWTNICEVLYTWWGKLGQVQMIMAYQSRQRDTSRRLATFDPFTDHSRTWERSRIQQVRRVQVTTETAGAVDRSVDVETAPLADLGPLWVEDPHDSVPDGHRFHLPTNRHPASWHIANVRREHCCKSSSIHKISVILNIVRFTINRVVCRRPCNFCTARTCLMLVFSSSLGGHDFVSLNNSFHNTPSNEPVFSTEFKLID